MVEKWRHGSRGHWNLCDVSLNAEAVLSHASLYTLLYNAEAKLTNKRYKRKKRNT